MTRCPSTFFGAQCDGTTGHRGHHWSDTPVDVNSYSVVWTDKSADDNPK